MVYKHLFWGHRVVYKGVLDRRRGDEREARKKGLKEKRIRRQGVGRLYCLLAAGKKKKAFLPISSFFFFPSPIPTPISPHLSLLVLFSLMFLSLTWLLGMYENRLVRMGDPVTPPDVFSFSSLASWVVIIACSNRYPLPLSNYTTFPSYDKRKSVIIKGTAEYLRNKNLVLLKFI